MPPRPPKDRRPKSPEKESLPAKRARFETQTPPRKPPPPPPQRKRGDTTHMSVELTKGSTDGGQGEPSGSAATTSTKPQYGLPTDGGAGGPSGSAATMTGASSSTDGRPPPGPLQPLEGETRVERKKSRAIENPSSITKTNNLANCSCKL